MSKRHTLHDVDLDEISLVDRGANQGAKAVLFKRDSEDNDMAGQTAELQALNARIDKAEASVADLNEALELAQKENTELQKQLDAATSKVADLEKAATIAKADEGKTDLQKALDAMSEDVRKAFTDMQARTAANEALVKKMADDAEEKEFVAKAAGLDKVTSTADKLGPLLRRIAKGGSDQADADEVLRLLKSANELIGTGSGTTEIGKSNGAEAGDALAELNGAAAELRKADTTLSQEAAIAKALENDPALYGRWKKQVASA